MHCIVHLFVAYNASLQLYCVFVRVSYARAQTALTIPANVTRTGVKTLPVPYPPSVCFLSPTQLPPYVLPCPLLLLILVIVIVIVISFLRRWCTTVSKRKTLSCNTTPPVRAPCRRRCLDGVCQTRFACPLPKHSSTPSPSDIVVGRTR